METLLSLTNKVLVRLRESSVTSTSASAYSSLISQFVAQAVDEVEDATNWVQLRSTITLPVVAGVYEYPLTGAGTGYRVLQVLETTTDYTLHKPPSYQWMKRQLLNINSQDSSPQYYEVTGTDSNGNPVVSVFPTPDKSYTIDVNLVIKTSLDSDSDETPVPWLPVVLRAYMLAVDERGDDGGSSLDVLAAGYFDALASAVEIDSSQHEEETEWFED